VSKHIPNSVRYIKNGSGGRWWATAKANNQVHAGWSDVPHALLSALDFGAIEAFIRSQFEQRPGATQDFRALRSLIDHPSTHIWITFEEGCMWWSTVADRIVVNDNGEDHTKGHFWLNCDRGWSNKSLGGTPLEIWRLPGSVTRTAGFQGTVCQPVAWQQILRLIRDERDPVAIEAVRARTAYEQAVSGTIAPLSWKDFELLADLILSRTGWVRVSVLGKTTAGVDLEVENMAANEFAFVQVKSSATQPILNHYISLFEMQRDHYARMFFIVHSVTGTLTNAGNSQIHIWTVDRLAQLVVRLGLGEWVENKLG
jgi:hypothetical protein